MTGPTPTKRTSSQQEQVETRLGWRMAGLAFTLSSEVAAGALLGWLVDWLAGTKPKGLIIGAMVGIAVGMLSFIRGALRLNKALSAEEARRPKRPAPLPPDPEPRHADDWDDNEDPDVLDKH